MRGGTLSMLRILAVWAIAIDSSVLLWWQLEGMDGKELDDVLPAMTETKRILVVYSGPSSSKEKKVGLYEANLKYFLANGGAVDDCGHNQNMIHDTVIVVGQEFYQRYSAFLENWKSDQFNACHQQNEIQGDDNSPTERSKVWLVGRRPECFDMESARLAFYGGLGVNILNYDYFIFVNCGLSGPGPMLNTTSLPWTTVFTSKLSETVKMSGLTLNSFRGDGKVRAPHMQSFLYALDHVGMEIMLKTGTIFDCTKSEGKLFDNVYRDIIFRYELGMGKAILNSGYALSPLHDGGNPACAELSNKNQANCSMHDMWHQSQLPELFGHMPSLQETLFFKTSRFITAEISKLINYTDDSVIA